jgi:hypothetical protein
VGGAVIPDWVIYLVAIVLWYPASFTVCVALDAGRRHR